MEVRKYPGIFEYYDMEQFKEPTGTSKVIMNTFWICTGNEFMRAKKNGVWQYHTNKSVAEEISLQLPGTEVIYMEFAYIPFAPKKND